MKERPILFNSEMVRAVLGGRKTQTRRVIKALDLIQDWDKNDKSYGPYFQDEYGVSHLTKTKCPYGKVGDKLWVREAWCVHKNYNNVKPSLLPKKEKLQNGVVYMQNVYNNEKSTWMGKTRPSIFMPRWASRINLRIINISVERVQEISPFAAIEEGIGTVYESAEKVLKQDTIDCLREPVIQFQKLWNEINKKRGYGWDVNPWVWVVEFKMID